MSHFLLQEQTKTKHFNFLLQAGPRIKPPDISARGSDGDVCIYGHDDNHDDDHDL